MKKQIDLLKIDLEVLDFEILKNLTLSKLDIELLMIEKSSKEENIEILKFLELNSYKIIHESNRNFIFKKS